MSEVDDAAVQLGILDGPQGLDDVGFGDGHGAELPRPGPSAASRVRATGPPTGQITLRR